jgi:hypothetical protein
MKGLRIQLKDEILEKFRRVAMSVFGYSKGSLSQAAESAISNWLEAMEIPYGEELEEDPVEVIEGLLEEWDIDSVELQHNLSKFWLQGTTDDVSN